MTQSRYHYLTSEIDLNEVEYTERWIALIDPDFREAMDWTDIFDHLIKELLFNPDDDPDRAYWLEKLG